MTHLLSDCKFRISINTHVLQFAATVIAPCNYALYDREHLLAHRENEYTVALCSKIVHQGKQELKLARILDHLLGVSILLSLHNSIEYLHYVEFLEQTIHLLCHLIKNGLFCLHSRILVQILHCCYYFDDILRLFWLDSRCLILFLGSSASFHWLVYGRRLLLIDLSPKNCLFLRIQGTQSVLLLIIHSLK